MQVRGVQEGTVSEQEFWMLIRRALLMAVAAIEKRYNLPPRDVAKSQQMW